MKSELVISAQKPSLIPEIAFQIVSIRNYLCGT